MRTPLREELDMVKIEELEGRLRGLGEQVGPELEKRLRAANHRAKELIAERPGTFLLGALAVGFVIGRIVRARG